MSKSITFYEILDRNEFMSEENVNWVRNVLNKGEIKWGDSGVKKVMEWLWKEYNYSLEQGSNHSNPNLVEIDDVTYSMIEGGVVALGYSFDPFLDELDHKLEQIHENHGVDMIKLVENYFCE